jgi:peptide-methionine (S)-S-oxide reductase
MKSIISIILSLALVSCVAVQPASAAEETAVFAGGCFWGVEGVFEHVKGVNSVVSGYAGGEKKTANYEAVGEGDTGHAESVMVKFDPTKVTYMKLLSVFFVIAHDSTQVDRQGPDVGKQYRSVIFYFNEEQRAAAQTYIDAINKSKNMPDPVATQLVPFKAFYEAEDYHQNFVKLHPDHPYVVYNDLPKLQALKERYPDLYVDKSNAK